MIALLLVAAQAGFTVDAAAKEVKVACKVAPRKLPNLPEVYPLEVVATWPAPKGQKAHETAVTFDAIPSQVHKAIEGLGLKAGKPARGEGTRAAGPELEMLLELPGGKRVALERVLVDRRTGRPLPPIRWHFTGSVIKQPDPTKPEKVYAADLSGTLVGIFPVTDETVIQSSLTTAEEPVVKLDTAKDILPAEGTALVLVIRAAKPAEAAAKPPAIGDEARLLGQSGPLILTAPAVPKLEPVPFRALPSVDPFDHRRAVPSGGVVLTPVRAPVPALPKP